MNARFRTIASTYGLLSPWILTLSIFWLYPLGYALYISFTKVITLTGESEWVGLANYTAVFNDRLFFVALQNTVVFALGTVPLTTVLALALAVTLNSARTRWKDVFRAVAFVPTVTSIVVISLIFTNLYAHDGQINALLKLLDVPYPERGWLLEPSTALVSVMAMDVWMSVGYYAVLFLAGLQAIPTDLYEAAELSAAGAWTQFRRITLPLLKPTMMFVLVINTIKSFQVFVEIYVMTKGGPLPLEGTTTTLVYEVYKNAFEKTDSLGYASAFAFVMFLLLLLLSLVQVRYFRPTDR
ncbi:MAG: carbohydrate ABC transporter permease [Candidatus Kapaibacterium sp.]